MNDSVPTFGFANDTGEPLIFDIALDAWRDAAGAVTRASECRGVTLAELAADVQDSRTDTETEHADTDAQHDTITRANLEDIEAWVTDEILAAEDRAAKRGRDETLAVVVKALRSTANHLRDSDFVIGMGDVAHRIEREQGDNR